MFEKAHGRSSMKMEMKKGLQFLSSMAYNKSIRLMSDKLTPNGRLI